jgi:hypothetical protein
LKEKPTTMIQAKRRMDPTPRQRGSISKVMAVGVVLNVSSDAAFMD